jgi:hypothetical protein
MLIGPRLRRPSRRRKQAGPGRPICQPRRRRLARPARKDAGERAGGPGAARTGTRSTTTGTRGDGRRVLVRGRPTLAVRAADRVALLLWPAAEFDGPPADRRSTAGLVNREKPMTACRVGL